VISADGSLAGFAGGTHLKIWLLEHEARVVADNGGSPALLRELHGRDGSRLPESRW
jgi:hypothetical protein